VKGIFVRFLSFGGAPRTTWRFRKKHSALCSMFFGVDLSKDDFRPKRIIGSPIRPN